jgi:hypothetical protein
LTAAGPERDNEAKMFDESRAASGKEPALEEGSMKRKSLIGLLAVFIAFSCMGVKCQKVMDPADSSTFSLSHPHDPPNFSSRAECVRWCQDTYRPLLEEANERHAAALIACGDDYDCMKEANRLHQEEVKAIQAERQACIRSCHSQGSVGGGF